MTPMDRAWIILKRQTTLGEFHPEFPSPYGPVTMQRNHPTKEWHDENEGTTLEELKRQYPNKKFHPPFENLMIEGLPTADPNPWLTRDWEESIKLYNQEKEPEWYHEKPNPNIVQPSKIKEFDVSKPYSCLKSSL